MKDLQEDDKQEHDSIAKAEEKYMMCVFWQQPQPISATVHLFSWIGDKCADMDDIVLLLAPSKDQEFGSSAVETL